MNKRLTRKSVGVFRYDLADYDHKVGEFNDYDAFFAYSMAVKRLGELEDEHDNYQQEIENLKYKLQYLTDCGIEKEEKYKEALLKCNPYTKTHTRWIECNFCKMYEHTEDCEYLKLTGGEHETE